MKPSTENATIAALTLFELRSWGHFPTYMRLLFEAWRDHGTGCLRAIVTNRFLDEHQFVFDGFYNTTDSTVQWVTLDAADEDSLHDLRARAEGIEGQQEAGMSQKSLAKLYRALLEKYCSLFPTRHILFMNLDEYLIAISTGEPAPADISGIFFRPDFYYASGRIQSSFRRRAFNKLQEELVLRLLDHPQLRVAFFIDPWVAEAMKDKGTAQVVCLMEPVRLPERLPTCAEGKVARSRLGAPADKKLFLLTGDISGRKGIWKLLDAITLLTPEETSRMCLAIVGRAEAVVEQRMTLQIKALVASTPVVIIRRAQYVEDSELADWFTATDVVLAPYIGHVGMSGILLLAAAHRKPVISTPLGAMGRITQEYLLGPTADPSNPAELAQAIRCFLNEGPTHGWDPETAYAFAKERSHDKFGEGLLTALRPFLA